MLSFIKLVFSVVLVVRGAEISDLCGACAKSASHQCYTKFAFNSSQCSCSNNDGKCGTAWYQWVCVNDKGPSFIDSACAKCNGDKGTACTGVVPSPTPAPPPPTPPPLCGACLKSTTHKCYGKFDFNDSQCTCINNDQKCGTEWYMWECVNDKGPSFIDSACAACHGDNQGACTGVVPAPTPSPPAPPPCGACMSLNSTSDECYGKYGFKDSQCFCVNNDQKCGTDWYMWQCKSDKGTSFINSPCTHCNGIHGFASPCTGTPPGPAAAVLV